MDADGNEATTADRYTTPAVEIDNAGGTVTMIGGRLMGASTAGLSGEDGKVLLGWIVFEAVSEGASALHVDLGKYHPEPPLTFDNFVKVGGEVDEPTNVPADLGEICVVDSACQADLNQNSRVDMNDFGRLKASMGTQFPDPEYDVIADINANGRIDMNDFGALKAEMGTDNCPDCGGQ
jgi:hypothetical protein